MMLVSRGERKESVFSVCVVLQAEIHTFLNDPQDVVIKHMCQINSVQPREGILQLNQCFNWSGLFLLLLSPYHAGEWENLFPADHYTSLQSS